MFVDFLSLLLFNTVAGYLVLACFVFLGIDDVSRRRWAAPFAVTGLVAFLSGLRLVWTWPLPGSYNVAFGEMTTLFGAIMLGLALALSRDWNLMPIAAYAIVGCLAAMVTGFRVVKLGLTNAPRMSGLAFVLAGLSGICVIAALAMPKNKSFRVSAGIVIVGTALVWAMIAFGAYSMHLQSFAKYMPAGMAPGQ